MPYGSRGRGRRHRSARRDGRGWHARLRTHRRLRHGVRSAVRCAYLGGACAAEHTGCRRSRPRNASKTEESRVVVIRRVLSGFADVESSAVAGPAQAVRAAGRACWAARWRVAWAVVVTVATVVLLAGAGWLAAFVAVPGG